MRRSLRAITNIRAIWLFFSNFCGFLLLYGIIVYMPILLVEQFGLSTFHSGLAISAASVVTALVASQAGQLKKKVSDGQFDHLA